MKCATFPTVQEAIPFWDPLPSISFGWTRMSLSNKKISPQSLPFHFSSSMEIQTGNEAGIGSRKTLSSTTKQTCLWKGFEKSTKKDTENWIFYPKPTMCTKY
jgi:hypothetical protein